jgi:hypothetical protein
VRFVYVAAFLVVGCVGGDDTTKLDGGNDATAPDTGTNETGTPDSGCTGYPSPPYGDLIGSCTAAQSKACLDESVVPAAISCATTCGSKVNIACGATADCADAGVCCLDPNNVTVSGTCPVAVSLGDGGGPTLCAATCTGAKVCLTDSDCTGGHCHYATLGYATKQVGSMGVCGL